jgi:cobaltochelatase CobS
MEDKLDMAALAALLSGKTLAEIHETIDIFRQGAEDSLSQLQKIESTSRQLLRGIVLELLSEKQSESLPLLEKFAFDSKPKHKNFPLLLVAMKAHIPVWLFGDTGSGKTTAAELAAEALKLPFRLISVCPTTTKSELFGYKDANGTYHPTAFREIFENGGVFLIDEIDNGNPSILSVLNTSLANDWCSFPDGNIRRHEDAIFVAAANTIGRGADIRYVGRNALDATTLDRFVYVRMDIDENLERALIGGIWDESMLIDIDDDNKVSIEGWHDFVVRVRGTCQDLGVNHIISPRATLYGYRLIQAGIGEENLMQMCIWKGIRETDKSKIEQYLRGTSIEPSLPVIRIVPDEDDDIPF